MALTQTKQYSTDQRRYYREIRSGTRTAANFTVTLGWEPLYVKVTNLTDKITGEWFSDVPTPNALQLKTVATGVRTYEDTGISIAGKVITVTIATATLETDDDVTLIEAFG